MDIFFGDSRRIRSLFDSALSHDNQQVLLLPLGYHVTLDSIGVNVEKSKHIIANEYLSNSLREKLLQMGELHVARVWDGLLMAGVDLSEAVSIQFVKIRFARLGVMMSEYCIRMGFEGMVRLGVATWKPFNNKLKGRPVRLYRLSSQQLIIERWELIGVSTEGDAIPFAAVSSNKAYRAHLHRAFLSRVGNWTRKSYGRRLGVKGRATYNYERVFADVVAIPQFESVELSWEDIEKLPKRAEQGPVFMLVSSDEINTVYQKYFGAYYHNVRLPLCAFLARREKNAGKRCYRVKQLANLYSVRGDLLEPEYRSA